MAGFLASLLQRLRKKKGGKRDGASSRGASGQVIKSGIFVQNPYTGHQFSVDKRISNNTKLPRAQTQG